MNAPRELEVLRTGPLALLQDLGRPGYAAYGVPTGGAADRAALRLANRLVANPEGAAGVEILLGGFAARARAPLTLALTGAHAPAALDGRPVAHNAVLEVRPGQVLTFGSPAAGLRTYLAVRGGLEASPTLGSRSTDTLTGLGPAPLRAGDVLAAGPIPDRPLLVDLAPVAPPGSDPVLLRAVPGPRADWVADAGLLAATDWTVSERSNRVGLRLDGPALARAGHRELASEGLVRGAVQVTPDGTPVLMLADHPVTGGYPVIAVVVDTDTDLAAQARPGQLVRFRFVAAPCAPLHVRP